MPVGTGSNSSMKNSFSLSSLQLSLGVTPEKQRLFTERPYSSLTKRRKDSHKEWRRSWGSTVSSENKDEFWNALQANYNFIMDNNLIDSCKEADDEICSIAGNFCKWTLKDFRMYYSEHYFWLNNILETLGSGGNDTLFAYFTKEMQTKAYNRKVFNEQADILYQANAECRDDIVLKVSKLNELWDSVEALVMPAEIDDAIDGKIELNAIKKWLMSMKAVMKPVSGQDYYAKWTKTEVETKSSEISALQRDLKRLGKALKAAKRRAGGSSADADGLERRWLLLLLQVFEWQCFLTQIRERQLASSGTESDEGPLNKYPRLNRHFGDESDLDVQSCDPFLMAKEPSASSKDGTKLEPKKFECDNAFIDVKCSPRALNQAVFEYKHEDTESDQDHHQHQQLQQGPQGPLGPQGLPPSDAKESCSTAPPNSSTPANPGPATNDDCSSSEDGFVFTRCPRPEAGKDHCAIRELVQRAEDIVRRPAASCTSRISRIQKWLNQELSDEVLPADSCDASGECSSTTTTGDESDGDKESVSSEDLNESVATCRRRTENSSMDAIADLDARPRTPESSRVLLRQGSGSKGDRPWSVSGISQLAFASAHHQVRNGMPSEPLSNFSISESALNDIGVYSNNANGNLTNSEDYTVVSSTDILKNGSSGKRKKLRYRKKSGMHSSKSGSRKNSLTTQNQRSNCLAKSGSFSGFANELAASKERLTASDTCHKCRDASNTSGTDDQSLKPKRFILGPQEPRQAVVVEPLDRDSSLEKSSLNTNNEEQLSSFSSEQAWDNYQEKYLSEAYSEAQDYDGARRLLEDCEDYRNFIDSQSDCWSRSSVNQDVGPFGRRPDSSDSEQEDFKAVLDRSRLQLGRCEELYREQINGQPRQDNPMLCDDLRMKSANQLGSLRKILDTWKNLPANEMRKAQNLYKSWQVFKLKVANLQEFHSWRSEISDLAKRANAYSAAIDFDPIDVESKQDLSSKIDYFISMRSSIKENKMRLQQLHIAMHHLISEDKDFTTLTMKSEITDLYALLNHFYERVEDVISKLNFSLQMWKQLDMRLEQLKSDMDTDNEMLAVLDATFRNKTVDSAPAKDIAKALSEAHFAPGEGSFSDSGISDEGSEQELSEREHRLASIKHLMRHIEAVASPKCKAVSFLCKQLEEVEERLKDLHARCRDVFAKSAFSIEISAQQLERRCSRKLAIGKLTSPGSPDVDPKKTNSWFWKIMKASFPFQLAIVALLCIACLMEPKCCDNVNNLSSSMTPQLRYVRGPPPV